MIRSVLAAFLFLFVAVSAASAQNCNAYPNTLTNGTNADATQVMGNFNYVLGCVRDKLTANRTYFVRTNGNDACNGLTNAGGSSGACAFLTIQKAINSVIPLDLAGFAVTIQVGSGTYTGAVDLSTPILGGQVLLLGDPVTPSNVVLNVSGSPGAVAVSNGAALQVSGFKLISTSASMYATSKGSIAIKGKMDFGSASSSHMLANVGGSITVTASYNITGGAPSGHMKVQSLGYIANNNNTATITGTPAFTSGFAVASTAGIIESGFCTWTGATSGNRYQVDTGGGISTGGFGPNYFPGSTAGIVNSPGWYL